MSLRRPVGLVALLATAASSLTLLAAPAAVAVSPGLVISQVYGGGGNAGATYTNDYVELFNRGATPASTQDLSVQYAGATGTGPFVAVPLPTASVPAGGSFLVQLAGGSTGAPLPAPDATGSLNLSGSAGKVALATGTTDLGCNGGSAACTPEQLARIVDLVGYGGANFFEGSAAAPAASNTTAVLRAGGGCVDTDQNGTDLAAGAPAPRNAGTAATPCGTVSPPPPPDPEPVPEHGAVVPVSAVQGGGAASPLGGQRVTVEAVVTGLRTTDDVLSGFSVQEQDGDADDSPATSEGLLVLCGTSCPTGLAAGDVVRATGVVGEAFGTTRLDASGTGALVSVEDSGAARPTPATITLPAPEPLTSAGLYEALESMLTTVTTPLLVTESFNLARFGQIVLAPERTYQFTHTSTPSVEGYAAHLAELARSRIVLGDDNDGQNDAITGPVDEPYPYPSGGLSVDNRFRAGDRIERLTGVLEYSFGAWGLRPAGTETYAFASANPRTAAPEPVGGSLRVASFNVLNYFRTIDTTVSSSSGPCGPAGGLDCRGADSEAELVRQRAKIVAALTAIDADVVGLIEIQNDDDVSLAHLVEGLNAATAPGTYELLRTGPIGTDAIKLAFVYKPATVELVGAPAVLDSSVDPRFEDTRSRPALAQTFRERASRELVTVSVNHFKSKGSACGTADPDKRDGAGNCDLTRTRAAQALADWLATDPTRSGDPDRLIIGDLNSYRREAPITTLRAAGYLDLIERFGGEQAYGYLFDGQLGYLDHALSSASLTSQVTGATEWHINADEPVLLDYNDTVRDVGEAAFERESAARELYAPGPYRSSDHDPVVVGLDLATAPVADAGGPYTVAPGRTVVLDASGSRDATDDPLGYTWDLDGDGAFDDATGVRVSFRGSRRPGEYPVAVRVCDGALSDVDETVVRVVPRGRLRRP